MRRPRTPWLGLAMLAASSCAIAFLCAGLLACSTRVQVAESGTTIGTTGTGGTGGCHAETAATTSASSSGNSQCPAACATDADCGGQKCAEVTPGGFKTCVRAPRLAPCVPGAYHKCCSSCDCKAGRCASMTSSQGCGPDGPPPDVNACFTDQCASDADCMAVLGKLLAVCLPAGVFGLPQRLCIPASCHTDADCTQEPGGTCAPISNPCCTMPTSLGCVYPGGCRCDADCASDGGTLRCHAGPGGVGTCDAALGCPVCASPETPIATPGGDRPIADLAPGDLVYTVEHAAVVAVPVLRVHRTAVEHHHVVRVRLASGSVLEISPGHPTADGRSFGDLRAGDLLDGHAVISAERVPYPHPFTYDVLPASETGFYYAGGALVGSTLGR